MRKALVTALCTFTAAVPAAALAATSKDNVDPIAATAPALARAPAFFDVAHHVRARHRAGDRKHARHAKSGTPAVLASIAACESGGDPHAIGGGGLYRGKYQFDQSTWASVGGKGDPAAASGAEQDRRAAILYAREGTAAWPVCGQ
jgi:hypothetical protein